ncbi:hypothetical protein AHF37_08337, partial [Paragonimus kellicotti]
HVELIPFRRPLPSIRSPLSPPSSARTLESANLFPTDQSLQPVIRLEAVRLVLEAPGATINDMQSDNEKPVVKSLEGTYVIQLNEACLLEAAEHRRLHPQSKLDPHWRRRMTSLSCSLPGNTSNIRLVVSVLPTAEMLAMDFFSNDSNAPLLGTYVIQLNEACLLEAAEHRRLHPQSKLDPHWRRRMTSLSCSLPGNTSNIRLVVSVLPTAEMLAMDFFSNDSNAPLLVS